MGADNFGFVLVGLSFLWVIGFEATKDRQDIKIWEFVNYLSVIISVFFAFLFVMRVIYLNFYH